VSIVQENPNDNIVRKAISIIGSSPAWMLQVFTSIVILIILIISMEISIRVYKNKEF
jgi:hypothetical protein